jgi:hypothetical protein
LSKAKLPLDIRKDVFCGTVFSGFHIGKTFVKQMMKVVLTTEPLVLSVGEDDKITLTVFCNENRFPISVAELGNLIILIS